MKTIEINGSLRTVLGRKESQKLRKEGKIPCVLYGGEAPIHATVTEAEIRKLIFTPDAFLLNLKLEDKEYKAIMQDVQFHPVGDQVIHIDFLEVHDDQPVKIEVPVKVKGFAKGVKAGGKLKQNVRKLKIKALPAFLPDSIDVNVENLEIGQEIRVVDMHRDNIEFLNSKTQPIISVIVTRAVKTADDTAATPAAAAAPAADSAK